MRITARAKEENREKILTTAEELFAEKGYEQTTTRDISQACGMAKGTLFNYFNSKETLAMTLIARAMESGRLAYRRRKSGCDTLPEELFLLIAAELRALRPYRSYIGPVLEGALSLFAKTSPCPAGQLARQAHLQAVQKALARHGFAPQADPAALTLYWSLYLGILAHWTRDTSKNQTATLSVLDYAVEMFSNTIAGSASVREAAGNE